VKDERRKTKDERRKTKDERRKTRDGEVVKKIYILVLRQLKRYVRSRSRVAGALVQPLLYLLALGYGFGAVYRQAGQGSYLDFLVPGVVGMSIIFTAIYSAMDVIWDRKFGFLKQTFVAPMPRFSIMLGRTLGGAIVATIQGCIVLLIALIVGFRPDSLLSMLAVMPLMFLMALMFTSLGMAIASMMDDMQGFQLIINVLVMPMFLLSGSLYPLNGLPTALAIIARLNPLTYGVDAFRDLLIGGGHYGLVVDVSVLLGLTLVLLAAGTYLFNRIDV
jgi:ABC-2 type transport system permease protein